MLDVISSKIPLQSSNASSEGTDLVDEQCVNLQKLFPRLPEVLLSKTTNQPTLLPTSLLERLNYLWNTANDILIENNDAVFISQRFLQFINIDCSFTTDIHFCRLSKSFMQIIIRHDIALPDNILIRICSSCSNLLIPGVNCTSRLRSRCRKSNINQSRKKNGFKNPLKSELVQTNFLFFLLSIIIRFVFILDPSL
jgi:RNase P subunit RPR2